MTAMQFKAQCRALADNTAIDFEPTRVVRF